MKRAVLCLIIGVSLLAGGCIEKRVVTYSEVKVEGTTVAGAGPYKVVGVVQIGDLKNLYYVYLDDAGATKAVGASNTKALEKIKDSSKMSIIIQDGQGLLINDKE